MADINIQEVTNHINIETANGYKLEFNGPVVKMNVVLSNYYTKTETDALLNDKADKADTYTISQINGMVQDIYTVVATKQNLITGAASTITNSNLTTNRAVISNASGKVAVSNVTSTELGYLSGVTSGVQTQLNNKASTSLDNLSAAGQMIVDTQNGTISNCVLEIPQNIKLELSGNVVTLKAGSTVVLTNSATYTTVTTTQDYSVTVTNGDYRILTFTGSALNVAPYLTAMGSGSTLPADNSQYSYFYLIGSPSRYYRWSDGSWVAWNNTGSYPLAIVKAASSVASFMKDSNGRDMIFNGAGFVGHHAFVYPNVKALIPNGFNADGSLKSNIYNRTSLTIAEMNNTNNGFDISSNTAVYRHIFGEDYQSIEELENNGVYHYIINDNIYAIIRNNVLSKNSLILFIKYTYNGTTVTDFAIRQPVRMATVEMLNNTLGDVETLLAAI